MQKSNYNETNGIVVGPEISRIFAEVILQQIDANIRRYLEMEEGLKFGVDYEIRRYVDDYFIFANDDKHIEQIFKILKKELKEYKLYINESKTNKKTTPFITSHAVGKRELNNLINSFYKKLIVETPEIGEDGKSITKRLINTFKSPYAVSQAFIREFQCIVKRNNLSYDSLAKEIVRSCKTFLVRILKDKKLEKNIDLFENLLLILLDVCFYAYTLNITSSTTFKIAQLIVLICKFLKDKPERIRHNIFSKISQDADFSMTIFQRKTKGNETNIETLNLLLALKKLDDTYMLSEDKLIGLFSLESPTGYHKLNYFHYITLLYYIEDNEAYSTIKAGLSDSIMRKFRDEKDPFTKAEYTLLFFDIINCPYISDEIKVKIMRDTSFSKQKDEAIEDIKKISNFRAWFMDWDKDIDLERVLKKKEWVSTY